MNLLVSRTFVCCLSILTSQNASSLDFENSKETFDRSLYLIVILEKYLSLEYEICMKKVCTT